MLPTPDYLTTNQSEEGPRADHAPLLELLQDSSLTPSRAGHSLMGISPLWPPLPGKAMKLFFSPSPKTLSPTLNSASVQRGWVLATVSPGDLATVSPGDDVVLTPPTGASSTAAKPRARCGLTLLLPSASLPAALPAEPEGGLVNHLSQAPPGNVRPVLCGPRWGPGRATPKCVSVAYGLF